MKARIITVKPRQKQAEEARDILINKGYEASILRGFNYNGEFNDKWKDTLAKYDREKFFHGKVIFNDFISLCCALSHNLAISAGMGDKEEYSLILEDDVRAEQVPTAEELESMSALILEKNIDIVLFSAYWKRPVGWYLEPVTLGNGAGCYLVRRTAWTPIFSFPIMGHIDQHFLQMHLREVVKVYVSHLKVQHAICDTTRNVAVWNQLN